MCGVRGHTTELCGRPWQPSPPCRVPPALSHSYTSEVSERSNIYLSTELNAWMYFTLVYGEMISQYRIIGKPKIPYTLQLVFSVTRGPLPVEASAIYSDHLTQQWYLYSGVKYTVV